MKTGAGAGLYFYGFKPDIDNLTFGEQGGSQWTLLADTGSVAGSGFVLKSGDTLTGPVNIIYGTSPGLVLTSTSPGIRFVQSDQVAASQNWLIAASGATMQIQSRSADFSTAVTEFSVDRSGQAFVRGQTVYHTGNLTNVSQLTNDAGYAAVSSSSPLGTVYGGTGANLGLNTGGVVYASSATSMAGGPTGAAGQALISAGSGAPTWTNQSNLSVGFATNASVANSATNASHASAADTATFATTAGTANLVDWANVSGHPTLLSQFTNDVGAGTATWASLTGTAPGVTTFPNDANYVTSAALGAYATNASLGNYAPLTGTGANGSWSISVTGSAGSVAYANVSGAPTLLSQFTNDITFPWSSLSGTAPGNLTFSNTAGYITAAALASYATTASLSNYALANGSNASSTSGAWGISVTGSSNSVNVITNTASATVYPVWSAASTGVNSLATTPLKLSFNPSSGDLTAGGNVTAYSDARLKEKVSPITDALAKVKSLTGITFTHKDTQRRGTGLIAQDVMKVLPEAVVNNESGYLSLAYGNLVGLLVEAIKEQQDQISALQSQINDLSRH
jgi:hypothetical protein